MARRFVRLMGERRDPLTRLGLEPRVVGIATGRHGSVFDSDGIDAVAWADQRERGASLGEPAGDFPALIARLGGVAADAHVVIETTPLDVQRAEPAISIARAAFAGGVHVVSANKGPVALAYRALGADADRAGVSWLFEGAVMDGIPVFALVRETLPACDVRGFRGVLNSTTNFVLTAMEQGEAFDTALRRMQDAGVAEADPSLDVDGWDAAAKTTALANVWLDAGMTPADVAREGLDRTTADRARAARSAGKVLKLVASAGRNPRGRVDARVALESLEVTDPLAILDGQANALEIDTWPLGRIVITQRDGGLEKTAYALLADLITVAGRVRDGHPRGARG